MNRIRRNVFLPREHAKSLDALAATTRKSKSSIVAAALAAYLTPDHAERREALLARRLERLSRQFERIERDQAILIETLALFIRHHFAITPPIPEAHQEAARAQGRLRFDQFVDQLARHLQRGQSLVRDLFEEIAPASHRGTESAEDKTV